MNCGMPTMKVMQSLAYDQFEYACPAVSPEDAAARALAILKEAESIDPGFLVYLLQDSNVLLLAGLRPQSPYNGFSPQMTKERMVRFMELLERHDIVLVTERSEYEADEDHSFSLFHRQVMTKVPETYGFAKKFWQNPLDYSHAGFTVWSEYMHYRLARMMDWDNELPDMWLLDWWAPHNILFGMLLGYPGEAISSNLWTDAYHKKDGREMPIDMLALPDDDYFGARVGYYISPDAARLPEAVKLFELWKQVREIVGQEYPKQKLESSKAFTAEYAAYDKYENDRLQNL